MKNTLTIMLVLFSTYMFAQNVGINSSGAVPDASAGLDINYTDKGILIPRVNITDITTAAPITSPITSLIVYNTNATTGPGYFFWNGSRWIEFFTGNQSSDWKLQGNTGTTVGTNFLGTTDNVSLSFKTNGSERMRILNTGNVGIGTTSPATKLHIQTTGSGEAFRITTYGTTLPTVTMGDDNGAPGVGYLSLWLASTPVERVRLTAGNGPSYINAGNVGIGTTTPDVKLEVVGAVHTSRLGTYGTYNSAQVQGIWSISEAYTIDTGSDDFGNQYGFGYAYNRNGGSPFASEHQIVFTNNGVINAAIGLSGSGYFKGNVGIGTTTPSAKLEIYGATQNIEISNTSETDAGITLNDAQATTSQYAKITYGCSDNDLNFLNASSTPRMVIESSGEVGIGTTSPAAKLHVNGSTRIDGDFYNQQVSYDTDFNSTWTPSSNNTWENTNLSITITTHGTGANGSDVFVACNGSFYSLADFFVVRIIRDGTAVIANGGQDAYAISSSGNSWLLALQGIDSPSAGSHTYTVQIKVSDSSSSNALNEGTMTVMEIKK